MPSQSAWDSSDEVSVMNIFLPEYTVSESVMSLDDRRLIKQVLECKIILEDTKTYENHPVKKFYQNKKEFVAFYGLMCCLEYTLRFSKIHKYTETFREFLSDCKTPFADFDIYDQIIYASGSSNSPECVRETDPTMVHALFRIKLILKWKNDKKPPKWTKRGSPEWCKEEI